MATRLCFINQKGGCGKSSTCFHLAGHFAESGLDVLLVDADPQGSLSQAFLGSTTIENLSAKETLAELFNAGRSFENPEALAVSTPFERIQLIRANQTLAPYNTPCPETAGLMQYALRSCLDAMRSFDLTLIDCPPNLYQCSWNAMLAADFVVIPVPPEDFGTQGLRVVHQAVENAGRLNPELRLLGHAVTRHDSRLLVHKAYERKLRSLHPNSIFATVIPEASAFKVALTCRQPVTYCSPRSKAARMVRSLGNEILERTKEVRSKREVA